MTNSKIIKTKLKKATSYIKKNKKKVLFITLISSAILFLLCIISLLLIISPKIQTEDLEKPYLSSIEESEQISKDNFYSFKIEGDSGMLVEYNGKTYESNENQLTIDNIDEGTQTFYIRSMKNYLLFKQVSKEETSLKVEFDYTKPAISEETSIKDEYYNKKSSYVFETTEEYINIILKIDDSETIIYSDEESQKAKSQSNNQDLTKCQIKPLNQTDQKRRFVCPLNFNEEKNYELSLFIRDKAGNEYQVAKQKTVKYLEPIRLVCNNLPTLTNQNEVSLSCTSNKQGSFSFQGKTGDLKAGGTFSQKATLEKEGLNVIEILLKDQSGREFPQKFEINKDTTKPSLDVTMPESVNWKSTFEFKAQSNENVTIEISVKAAYQSCGYWNSVGTGHLIFDMEANKSYTKTFTTRKYQECFYSDSETCYAAHAIDYIIKVTDAAGNTNFTTRRIRQYCIDSDCPYWWESNWR
jgi:hypothetical protein